jgi:thymidylate synthase
MRPIHLDCTTIADAWFRLLHALPDYGYRQDIQQGSFENEQHRIQFPGMSVYIEHPDKDMVPVIPAALGIPAPTSEETIQDYFANYLMDPILAENETYKYASRINESFGYTGSTIAGNRKEHTQLSVITDMLKKTPLTNQACIEIAKPVDVIKCVGNDGKLDPPCLRLIDFKVIPGSDEFGLYPSLSVSVYFRSWDLWAGFPTNLGGIELLKQYVASECGLENGSMYAYSAGAHIYGYHEEIAKIRTGRK